MLAKTEQSDPAREEVRKSCRKKTTAYRALLEAGQAKHVIFACETEITELYKQLMEARIAADGPKVGLMLARGFGGRLCFRGIPGDTSGQSDYSPVNFPIGSAG